MTRRSVATVLLVSDPLRRERLDRWLQAVGEPVTYTVRWVDAAAFLDPHEAALDDDGVDVLVLDGPSMRTVHERARLLRAAQGPRHRYATLLYVENAPGERQRVGALSADDVVPAGDDQDARLGRMVQAVALAPWKRAERTKQRASALGDQRVRPLPGGRPAVLVAQGALLDEARGMGPQLARLMMESVRVGRAAGAQAAFSQIAAMCAEYAREIETVRTSLEEVASADGPSAAVHARLQGAADAVVTLQETVRSTARITREQLEATPLPLRNASAEPSEEPS